MTIKYFLILSSFFFLHSINAQVFWQDDFGATTPEMGGGTRLSSVGVATDGTCCTLDRFVRSENFGNGTCCGCNTSWSNLSGTWAWGGEDLDGTAPCSNQTQTITWSGIDISGKTNLEFIGLFGIRESTSWEGADQLKIQYRIAGGALTDGVCFVPNTTALNDLGLDADCDGTIDVVDGDLLSTALTEHTFSIAGTGTSIELIFTANVNAPGEEFVVDNFRLNEGVAMPVELTTFTATRRDKNTLLEWQTASEVNNDYFQVEHSKDGRNFIALDQIKGIGNTVQEVNDYSYLDTQPKTGVTYYRLKQVDFDGAFEYSNVVTVEYINDKGGISVYPNPFDHSVTLQFPLLEHSYSNFSFRTIEIYDIYGRLVQSMEAPMDETSITIDLSKLSSGSFILNTFNENTLITQRITKF